MWCGEGEGEGQDDDVSGRVADEAVRDAGVGKTR